MDFPLCFFISTHALREEGDPVYVKTGDLSAISTHALREEGDDLDTLQHIGLTDFYPRPPRGGRRPVQRPEA